MKFREFIRIIEAHGFVLQPRNRGSHAKYKGVIKGLPQIVIVAAHSPGDDIAPGTLAAMIRQTGLPRHLFR